MVRRWLVLVIVCAACGDDRETPIDAAVDADPFGMPSDVYPAFRPPVPKILKSDTGSVIASPRVVQAYFNNDSESATLQDYVGKLSASTYWAPMVAEYGVGSLTVATPVSITMAAPTNATDAEIQTFLAAQLDGTHAEWGGVDATTLASTIFLLHYPVGSTVTGIGTPAPQSCTNMGGYHGTMVLAGSGARVTYAVTISCAQPPPWIPTSLDSVTSAIGHELVEAATDPKTPEGYGSIATTSLAWVLDYGAELGDVCEMISTSWYKPSDLGYTIQRSWSNASAHDYHNPCVPIPAIDMPFFATAPAEADTITLGLGPVRGTSVQVGVPRTIELRFFSDGPTSGPWTVEALDDNAIFSKPAILKLEIDRPMGQNGNVAHLTITAMSRPATGYALYRLRSVLGGTKTAWYGFVGISP